MSLSHTTIARLFAFALPLLALTACRPHDFPLYPANYREYAYVTNGDSNTVSVLDVVNMRLDREIAVGLKPIEVAVSPTRNEVYVVNSGALGALGSVSVINAENNTVTATIQVRRAPVSIEIDPAGNLAYVANSGSNSVSVLDLKARREIADLAAGEEPVAARLSPDGKTLAVANRKSGSISLIDPVARRLRAIFEGCPGTSDLVILPDSSKVFAACSAGHQVMILALARTEEHPSAANPQPLPTRPDTLEALLDVGQAPVQLALKPDGGEIFASNALSNSISEIYNTTDEVGGATMIGNYPVRGLVSADNSLLYVANLHSQYVTVYSIDDGKLLSASQGGSIRVGDGPSALAFSAAGHLLFAVDTGSNDVAVIRVSSRSLFTYLSTGRAPNAIALKNFNIK
ncbi:MAG: YncE family protein [Terracidiphilus sp.]